MFILFCRGHNELKDQVILCLGSIGQLLGIDCDRYAFSLCWHHSYIDRAKGTAAKKTRWNIQDRNC